MWRTVASGVIAGAVMVGGLWAWRSPTVTLVRLKLALDHHDLAGVESALDFDALTGAALSGLLEDRAGESETVRLALRGKGGWLPAVASAQDKFFTSNGVRIRYVDQGAGEPVVLVHGYTNFIENNWIATGVLPNLVKDHRP